MASKQDVMKRLLFFLPLCVLIFLLNGCGTRSPEPIKPIKEINSIMESLPTLESIDTTTLVVFDVDDTLQVSKDAILRTNDQLLSPSQLVLVQKFYAEYVDYLQKKNSNLSGDLFMALFASKLMLHTRFRLVEEITASIINALRARGIKVIALTAAPRGKWGVIDNFGEFRFATLKKLGIDLSGSFEMQEMPVVPEGAVFYKGILLAEAHDKGTVLTGFLNKISWKPTKIIFFDDNKRYLEQVADVLKKLNIEFVGYWYKAALLQGVKLDSNVLGYQLQYMKEHDNYINEADATVIMQRQNKEKVLDLKREINVEH